MSQRNLRRRQAGGSSQSSQSQPSTSQASTSRSSRQGNRSLNSSRGNQSLDRSIPADNENYRQYALNIVKFVLNQTQNKRPIKRADLVKECCNGITKAFPIILPMVQNDLKTVFGIKFQEVTSTKGSNKQYICYTDIKIISDLRFKSSDFPNHSLLQLILSYIFLKGASIGENVLFNFLERVGVNVNTNVDHEYFGDVKKCLETYKKQCYIKREKKASEASNEERTLLEWGERSLVEFDKKTMLIENSQVFSKPTLYFKKQHNEFIAGAENMETEPSNP